MKYVKQLDSLRAIAILLVIISHWLPQKNKLNIVTSIFNGVDVFFVLSGFLITWILLENKKEAEALGLKKGSIIKSFFIRRGLRIFPIYYLLLIFLFVFADKTDTAIKENFHYFVTYTANLYFYEKQGWDGMLSHLWSLSVEEQFYLVWPWVMLFCNKRFLLPAIITSIFIGIAVQQYVLWGGLLTFGCFDGFGFGALLAWALVYKPDFLRKTKYLWRALAVVATLMQVARVVQGAQSFVLPSRTLTAIVTFWVVLEIVMSKEKRFYFFDFILNNRVLMFMGKISYGIYLYHLVLSFFLFKYLYLLNTYLPKVISKYNFYLVRLEGFLLLVLVSYLSWLLIEKPILGLKKNFEYQSESQGASRNSKVKVTAVNAEAKVL